MPIQRRRGEALCRRALRPDKGARQPARGIARSESESHQGAETCRRRHTDEVEAGNGRFKIPRQDRGPPILSKGRSQRWAQKAQTGQVDTKSGRCDDVFNMKGVIQATLLAAKSAPHGNSRRLRRRVRAQATTARGQRLYLSSPSRPPGPNAAGRIQTGVLVGNVWINSGALVLKRDRNPGPKPDGGCRILRHNESGPLCCEPPLPVNFSSARRLTITTSHPRSCRRPARSIAEAPPPTTATRAPEKTERSRWLKLCDTNPSGSAPKISGTYRNGPTPIARTTRRARTLSPSSRLTTNSSPTRSISVTWTSASRGTQRF